MNTPATIRRPYFMGEDDGFASIPEFSGNHSFVNYQTQPYIMRRKNSFRNFSSSSSSTTTSAETAVTMSVTGVCSPRSAPHFLESCSLCRKPLPGNRDIFMYRGDTPFCSEECRQEQIEIDEAKEKKWNFKSLRIIKDSIKSSSSSPPPPPSKAQNYPFRPSTVAAA